MALRYPEYSFDQDRLEGFPAAGNLPRFFAPTVNYNVQKIRRGDTVRVVYPNGKIYDLGSFGTVLDV